MTKFRLSALVASSFTHGANLLAPLIDEDSEAQSVKESVAKLRNQVNVYLEALGQPEPPWD